MKSPVSSSVAVVAKHHRSVKNYLLDPAFQLKYTGYLMAIALLLSTVLGGLLWRTSQAALQLSQTAVAQGMETVRRGQELVKENQKVSTMAKMTIDKAYADQPELTEVFGAEDQVRSKRLEEEQGRLEAEARRLSQRAHELKDQQQNVTTILVLALTALVVLIGLVGIVVTHKVAGPIFKMKRQIRELGEGYLRLPGKLRKGDELVDFFETFERTVKNLRGRQEAEILQLETALEALQGKIDAAALRPLEALRDDMRRVLGLQHLAFRKGSKMP